MKEACQAMIDTRRNRARGHRLKHSHEVCSGLTDKEWNAVVTKHKVNYKTNKL
jgi:hypothetical protein